MASVYIETTVPSYYHETRRSAQAQSWKEATRAWWNTHSRGYDLVTSRLVVEELSRAPGSKAKAAVALLGGVAVLDDPPGLVDVAEYYIQHRLMPAEAAGDAVHLAVCSLHNIDFMLTWNCRHLANANKARHLAVLNGRLGLPVPIIATPLTLVPE